MVYELLCGESLFASLDFQTSRIGSTSFRPYLKWNSQEKNNSQMMPGLQLAGLLNRDVALRLGCGPFGASQIFSHHFYSSIEWGKLIRKALQPPFDPEIQEVEKELAKYIEEDFLDQSVSWVDVEALEGSDVPHASVGVKIVNSCSRGLRLMTF